MPLYLFYTMVQKSQKWPKTQIKGPALKRHLNEKNTSSDRDSIHGHRNLN